MPESRRNLFLRIATLVGRESLIVEDPRDGWPGLAQLKLESGLRRVALHVGPVGRSHRNRDASERRFQNPGKDRPLSAPTGYLPLLVGLWEEQGATLLVCMEAEQRLSRPTRQSLFAQLSLLVQASELGWSEHTSTSGELIVALYPSLLPAYVQMKSLKTRISPDQIRTVLQASGIAASSSDAPEERARRTLSILARSARFGRDVVASYDGLCAMCGLSLGLVQAAHIYPASAPDSPDDVKNGLALCANHHVAFDRHMIWVDPETSKTKISSRIRSQAKTDASSMFIESTLPILLAPVEPDRAPSAEMFTKRYQHFDPHYRWVSKG